MAAKLLTAVIGVALAIAGGLCAQALAQVGVPPVTVSVPTVSLPVPTPPPPPTPPVPPVPPAPVPPPPPPPVEPPRAPAPVPQVPVPVPPPAPPPAPPASSPAPAPSSPSEPASAPAGSSAGTPAAGGGSSTGGAPSGSGWTPYGGSSAADPSPRRPAGARSGAAITRVRAERRTISSRAAARRRGTRLTFVLSAPARVVFVVRGPAPSCGVVGRFAVRGDRGVNRVRFTGRVGRRTLGPGTYRIAARTPRATRTIVVSIVEPGSAPAPARFACASSGGRSIFTLLAERFDVGGASGSSSASGSTADGANSSRSTGTAAAIAAETPTPNAGEEDSDVLPAITRRVTALPSPLPEAGSPPWIVGAVAFGLLILGALAILAYLVRFLRRPHAT